MEEKLKIVLMVAGHRLPVSVADRGEKEKFQRAAKEVNDLYTKYKSRYDTKSDAKCLAMAAVQIAKRSVDIASSRTIGSEIDSLADIDRQLDDYLNSIKQ